MAHQIPVANVWHAGEQAIQQQVGVAGRMAEIGPRIIRDYMPDQHRDFFAQLPFLVAGVVDGKGDPWASLLEGESGFMTSPSPTQLDIDAQFAPGDPAGAGVADGAAIGLLGIELDTRRRNRMNGRLGKRPGTGWQVTVDQSFGNCPQYIQLRDFTFARDPMVHAEAAAEYATTLDEGARAMIAAADTFFVASYAGDGEARQVDVSHRGGKPGFVRIDADGTLTIPDFAGNLFFSTLGNIHLNGKAGLVFVDFASGDVLQLTGDAALILDSPEIAAFQGAERLWTFRPRKLVLRRGAMALRWAMQADGWSPNALMTGDWDTASERLRAAALAKGWRPFRVAKIVEESSTIHSFQLEPDDGAGILPHLAGQHLPIRLALGAGETPVIRTYTLSVAPSDGYYRISVKRDGAVSTHLHDHVRVGERIEARAPAGDFIVDAREARPAVLLAAGVGITPMLAMLRHIVYEGLRTRRVRPTVLFHSARSMAERPFDAENAALAAQAPAEVRVVRVLSDPAGAQPGADFESAGRIDIALLTRHLGSNDYDFYLCGPPAFTQGIYDGLRGLNVADNRIHAEAFGPSSLVRSSPASASAAPLPKPATSAVPVAFTASTKEARWTPESGSLLDLAETRGLSPEYSCRAGNCGSCKTRLLNGQVTYPTPPSASVAGGEVLICCAVPAESADGELNIIQLDL
jgi:ferredoxin-NADP reductase/predicted pyridoxine 5'-phosphate oxidase superfamily flavin-nucleotide-binding protein